MDRAEVFQEYRPLLFAIAYRMLGTAMDAEDMVQEAYLRWQQAPVQDVSSPKAYLSAIITRLCIDELRSARVRREAYVGPWLPEPMVMEQPADRVALAESLSTAFLVLLESLSPAERAVFLLREVFDYDYAEIAHILETSQANCRQMFKRAKDHIAARRPRFNTAPEQRNRLMAQFVQACTSGDMNGLLALFTQDVTLYSDGGGKVRAARNPIYGSLNVARYLLGVLAKAPAGLEARLGEANGQEAVLVYLDGQPYAVVTFDVDEDRIRAVYNQLNPDKLRNVPRLH
jgi:RNA polymerase sigma-70 factor (ECF subfamily)